MDEWFLHLQTSFCVVPLMFCCYRQTNHLVAIAWRNGWVLQKCKRNHHPENTDLSKLDPDIPQLQTPTMTSHDVPTISVTLKLGHQIASAKRIGCWLTVPLVTRPATPWALPWQGPETSEEMTWGGPIWWLICLGNENERLCCSNDQEIVDSLLSLYLPGRNSQLLVVGYPIVTAIPFLAMANHHQLDRYKFDALDMQGTKQPV